MRSCGSNTEELLDRLQRSYYPHVAMALCLNATQFALVKPCEKCDELRQDMVDPIRYNVQTTAVLMPCYDSPVKPLHIFHHFRSRKPVVDSNYETA